MSIGKRLYLGFGAILGILGLLFIVNIFAGWRETSASTDASTAVENLKTVGTVRDKIMRNRLDMNNFLLSGDPRDEEKLTKGFTEINELIKRGEAQGGSEVLKTSLIQLESTEASWADNFAKPLLAKRHQVDSGDATVSDLQIFYLQKDTSSGLEKSLTILNQAIREISKAQEA